MTNIFNEPLKYISEISDNISVTKDKRKVFRGKTMAFVF